jgi:hypothetical protein
MSLDNFKFARDPGISGIDSHMRAYHTDFQACFTGPK